MFDRRSWRFTTTLNPSQCAERLRSVIDGDFTFAGSKPVIGRVRPQGAILRKRLLFRTPYQMVVRVGFQPSGDGARVACEARMDWFSTIFGAIWSGFSFLVGGLVVVLLLSGAATLSPGVPLFVALLAPLGMIAFAVLLPWLGCRSANRHAAFVADFVEASLGVEDGAPAAGATKLRKAS